MARNTADDSAADEPIEIPAYAFYCSNCGENVALDEVPDNRIAECPYCEGPMIIPDTLGNEDEIIRAAEAREES